MKLSRRRFLRGTGVVMALPWLESMPVWGAAADGRGGRARSGSRFCSWATASTPTSGGPRDRAPTMELGRASRRWSRSRASSTTSRACSTKRPPASAFIPGMTGNLLSGAPLTRRAPSCTAASASIRCWPATSASRPCSPAWSWAASSRSPAITRRTSRWPTARTSRGRAPTSPVPMEVYPSLAFDSLFENRGSQRNLSVLDRVMEQADVAQPAGQLDRQGQARRISHQRARRREARAGHARGEREGRRERDAVAAGRRRRWRGPTTVCPRTSASTCG